MKLYGLIGYPIAHSYSAAFFKDKFATLGLEDHRYLNFPITAIDQLPLLLQEEPGLNGLNVTIPYKRSVLEYLDEVSPDAAEIGAVNTIVISNNKLRGHNTDWVGFEGALKPFMVGSAQDIHALILGTGGSASAVAYALAHMGIAYTRVSRQPGPDLLTYDDLTAKIIADHRLIVQTTPLGMYPHEAAAPKLDYSRITREHVLFDLIYNPAETEFLRKGRGRGAVTINGLEMLGLQAEAAWQIWQNAASEADYS